MSHKKKKLNSRNQSARLSRVVFLGTSSAQPIPLKRNVSSLVIQTSSGNLSMVDCGEGTQHQLKLSTLKIGKLRNIFITHLHGDHCYGLFGLLHSIRNEENTDFTLNIYGPTGIKQMIHTTLTLSGGLYHYNLNIREISLPETTQNNDNNSEECGTKNDEEMSISCNEETDDDSSMHQLHAGDDDDDENDNILFSTNDTVDLGEIEAGIRCIACRLTHRIETFGYVFIERDQFGKLDAAKAMALGAKGRQLGQLKSGQNVELNDGTVIYSADVVGAAIVGNKIGIMQDCSDCRSCFDVAQSVDLLIHECTYDEMHKQHAIPRGHSTAKMAAHNALKLNAKMLMLTHFSSRFVECGATEIKQDNDDEEGSDGSNDDDLLHVQRLQKEAEQVITNHKSKCIVRCAADFMSVRFGKNKSILIDKQLAVTESKRHHFLHDLPYLKLICD